VSSRKRGVELYGTETLIKFVNWRITFHPHLIIRWRSKHLLDEKVVLHENLLRLLHLRIDLHTLYVMRGWRSTLGLRFTITCGFLVPNMRPLILVRGCKKLTLINSVAKLSISSFSIILVVIVDLFDKLLAFLIFFLLRTKSGLV